MQRNKEHSIVSAGGLVKMNTRAAPPHSNIIICSQTVTARRIGGISTLYAAASIEKTIGGYLLKTFHLIGDFPCVSSLDRSLSDEVGHKRQGVDMRVKMIVIVISAAAEGYLDHNHHQCKPWSRVTSTNTCHHMCS